MTHTVKIVLETAERIEPILAGKLPEVQSAILAELLAMWLAGHFSGENNASTDRMREELLQHHIQLVRDLLSVIKQ